MQVGSEKKMQKDSLYRTAIQKKSRFLIPNSLVRLAALLKTENCSSKSLTKLLGCNENISVFIFFFLFTSIHRSHFKLLSCPDMVCDCKVELWTVSVQHHWLRTRFFHFVWDIHGIMLCTFIGEALFWIWVVLGFGGKISLFLPHPQTLSSPGPWSTPLTS